MTDKTDKRKRGEITRAAKGHIKSIQTALSKYMKGSDAEQSYALEHFYKLEYYLKRL